MTFASAARPTANNFTLGVTLLIAATVFFGFSFTIYPDVLARLRPAVLYLHVISAAGWLLLLVAQVVLVRQRKVAQHRRVGVYGLWLGAIASVSSFATALVLRHESVIRHGPNDRFIERIAFLSVPLAGFLIFTGALALAALWRRRPAFHRRAIMLAAVVLMEPGLARVPVLGDLPHFPDGAPILVLLLLCAHDYWSERRIHPVYLAGVPIAIAVLELGLYLADAHPAWWVAMARLMIGV
jgi:hypothetical protein